MWKITLLLTMMLADEIDIIVSQQLPCDSPLRIVRPQQFKHCSLCSYGTWSRWKNTNHMVHKNNCSSGYFHEVTRIRKDINGKCNDETEMDYRCK